MVLETWLDAFEKIPNRREQVLLMTVVEYTTMHLDVRQADFHKADPDNLTPDCVKDARSPKKRNWGSRAYRSIAKQCYHYARTGYLKGSAGFTYDDVFFLKVIVGLFPPLSEEFPELSDRFAGTMHQIENFNPTLLQNIAAVFKNGAFVYRYAYNHDEGLDPSHDRFARGKLDLEYTAQFGLRFAITYRFAPDGKKNHWHDETIGGPVYLVGSFVIFAGVETTGDYPLFMVIRNSHKGVYNSGLVLRKHPGNQGFFAAKVAVVKVSTDGSQARTGTIKADDFIGVPDVEGLVKDLINIGNNNGRGVLTL